MKPEDAIVQPDPVEVDDPYILPSPIGMVDGLAGWEDWLCAPCGKQGCNMACVPEQRLERHEYRPGGPCEYRELFAHFVPESTVPGACRGVCDCKSYWNALPGFEGATWRLSPEAPHAHPISDAARPFRFWLTVPKFATVHGYGATLSEAHRLLMDAIRRIIKRTPALLLDVDYQLSGATATFTNRLTDKTSPPAAAVYAGGRTQTYARAILEGLRMLKRPAVVKISGTVPGIVRTALADEILRKPATWAKKVESWNPLALSLHELAKKHMVLW